MKFLRRVGGPLCIASACVLTGIAGGIGGTVSAQIKTVKIEEFSGYWSGVGTVTWTNGTTEQLKCVATYRPGVEQVRQNLRCASQGYSISAAVDLKIAGDSVTGTWEEKTYSANGAITGKVNDKGFVLSIVGPTFSADMTVDHTMCKQAIDIDPKGLDVVKIKIGLGKC